MIHQRYLNELAKTISGLKSSEEATKFLMWILTPRELEKLPLRLQIVKRLKRKMTQRRIAKELGVGIATVTRGSREFQANYSIL